MPVKSLKRKAATRILSSLRRCTVYTWPGPPDVNVVEPQYLPNWAKTATRQPRSRVEKSEDKIRNMQRRVSKLMRFFLRMREHDRDIYLDDQSLTCRRN